MNPRQEPNFENALSEGLTVHNDVSAFVFHIKIILITQTKNGGHLQIVGAHSPP